MGDSQYSSSLTTFSPSGKLVQIEHALTAVGSGQTSLGIKAANGVVIATEKKLPSILVDETSKKDAAEGRRNDPVVFEKSSGGKSSAVIDADIAAEKEQENAKVEKKKNVKEMVGAQKQYSEDTTALDKDAEIRQEIERRETAEAKLHEAYEELNGIRAREVVHARKAAILAKELRDEKLRHAAALNDLQVKFEQNRREELERKDVEVSAMVNGDEEANNEISILNLQFPTSEAGIQTVEWPAQPERDKQIESMRRHIDELEIIHVKLLRQLAEAKDKLKNFSGYAAPPSNVETKLKKQFKPDGSLSIDLETAIAKCHDIFICPYEVGHMSLREFLSQDDSRIFRVCNVPGKKVVAHLSEGLELKVKKYVIPPRRINPVHSEPDLEKMSPLGKFVMCGIVDCPYKLQRHGLSLNGNFTLDSYRVTADRKIKLDSALKSLVCIRTPNNMQVDYATLPSVIAEIVSLYDDISSIPFDLQYLIDLLSSEDPVAKEVIIRYNVSLMDEILKRDHYIIMYNRLEQIEKEDKEMGRANFRSDKVMKFIRDVQDGDDWRDWLHRNKFVEMIRNKHQSDSTHKSPNEARNMLETWRHNFTHLHELATEFQDKDEVDIMDSVKSGVINQFQEGMFSIGELDVPHLVATMKQ